MEVFGIILSILAALTLVILLKRAFEHRHKFPFYQALRRLLMRKKQAPPPLTARMFVAVRRRRTGRTIPLITEEQENLAFLQHIRAQIQQLCADWATIAVFEWGFHGSDYGLPSPSDDSWQLFASYVVVDYTAFRACLAALESERYLLLRDQCDIRLLFGEQMTDLAAHINRLF